MGQKVHPNGFRVGITKKYQSIWFAKSSDYRYLLEIDQFVRKYLKQHFPTQKTGNIIIDLRTNSNQVLNRQKRILIDIHTAVPRTFLVLKTSTGKNVLRTVLSFLQRHYNAQVQIQLIPILKPLQHAKLIAETIGSELEERKNFRRAMKQAVSNSGITSQQIKGIKIQISGRLNGVEMARSEWIRFGCIPLQTLTANIEYYSHSTQTTYGLFGIKVWVFLPPT